MKIIIYILITLSILFSSFGTEPEVIWWQISPDISIWSPGGDLGISDLDIEFARIKTSEGEYLLNYYAPVDGPDDSIEAPSPGEPWTYAVLPDDYETMNFIVELGNWDNDDNWTIEALSRSYAYQEVVAYIQSDWGSPGSVRPNEPWTPTAFVVPEPSSALLLLVGFGFLGLKRKMV